MPQATSTVSVHSQKRVGMTGSRPSRRFALDSCIARRPRVWLGSSFIAERRSTAKVFGTASLPPARALGSMMLGLGDLPDHEADVRVARERRRLEDALHDERLNHLVDLQDADARERLAGAALRRLPQLALR